MTCLSFHDHDLSVQVSCALSCKVEPNIAINYVMGSFSPKWLTLADIYVLI